MLAVVADHPQDDEAEKLASMTPSTAVPPTPTAAPAGMARLSPPVPRATTTTAAAATTEGRTETQECRPPLDPDPLLRPSRVQSGGRRRPPRPPCSTSSRPIGVRRAGRTSSSCRITWLDREPRVMVALARRRGLRAVKVSVCWCLQRVDLVAILDRKH